MKITSCSHINPEIEIIELYGELSGRGALRLEEYLCVSMDSGKFAKLIDLKNMRKADGLGLNILENFINRGMSIRLFNAGLEMLNLLKISGKDGIIKVYNCQDHHQAVLLFEKEMIEEGSAFSDNVKKRRFKRVDASLQSEFKSRTSHNGDIAYKAVIENLSEGGVLMSRITVLDTMADPRVTALELVGKELCEITFSLNGDLMLIEANG
ncbi:MAG: hypothetical protein GY941_01285, partial [Planctomycetes bacterium]|nr:hypothetical protein [Planctomycetota bacterium]